MRHGRGDHRRTLVLVCATAIFDPVRQPERAERTRSGESIGCRDRDASYPAPPYVRYSLDLSKLPPNPGVHSTDGDFSLAWVKTYGEGRVFYGSFAHDAKAWITPTSIMPGAGVVPRGPNGASTTFRVSGLKAN